MDIQSVSQKLNLKYYKSLQISLSHEDITIDWLNQHINSLQDTINDRTDTPTTTDVATVITSASKQVNDMNKHSQIFEDASIYKKPWVKLNPIHKILKIKEYVNSLKIYSEKERALLKDELIELIKIKVLTKKENVDYDQVNGKIESLKNLQYENGKYFYLYNK